MNLEMLTTDIMLTVQENNICLKPGKEMYICTLFLCTFIKQQNGLFQKKSVLGSKNDKVEFNFPPKI